MQSCLKEKLSRQASVNSTVGPLKELNKSSQALSTFPRCGKIHKIISLQTEMVYFTSWFWDFQPIAAWCCHFGVIAPQNIMASSSHYEVKKQRERQRELVPFRGMPPVISLLPLTRSPLNSTTGWKPKPPAHGLRRTFYIETIPLEKRLSI